MTYTKEKVDKNKTSAGNKKISFSIDTLTTRYDNLNNNWDTTNNFYRSNNKEVIIMRNNKSKNNNEKNLAQINAIYTKLHKEKDTAKIKSDMEKIESLLRTPDKIKLPDPIAFSKSEREFREEILKLNNSHKPKPTI